MASIWNHRISLSLFGEAEGPAIGVVLDNIPPGEYVDIEELARFMTKRTRNLFLPDDPAHQHEQLDFPQVISGLINDRTTGSPLCAFLNNPRGMQQVDYTQLSKIARPGHADYTFDEKYGFRDYRGGGRSSGRETAGRVAAGAIAIKLLSEFGINFTTFVESVGDISIDYNKFDKNEISNNKLYMPDKDAAEKAAEYLKNVSADKDSSGAVVKCIIDNVPAGLGDPVFDKLDARLASAIMSIGAVKSFEVGNGKAVSKLKGSENNDEFYIDNGEVRKKTNNSGGILGGISDGSSIILTSAFKPTPSIYKSQKTVNNKHEDIELEIKGRHDPIIAPRAVVVVEAMSALVIADALLMNCSSKLDNVKKIYEV